MDVVALEGVHEGLGDAVRLRAADGREARFQAQLAGEDAGIACGVSRAIVRQHLDGGFGAQHVKAGFHGFQHDVAHIRTGDAGIDHRAKR